MASDCRIADRRSTQCYALACNAGRCEAEPKDATATCTGNGHAGLCASGTCEVCASDALRLPGRRPLPLRRESNRLRARGPLRPQACATSRQAVNGCEPATAWCSADYVTRIQCEANGQTQTPTTMSANFGTGNGQWVECVLDEHCPNVSLPAATTKHA